MADALWLADAIRGQGVGVVEVDGWRDRGHGNPDYDAPRGVFVWHHTADGPNGVAPSLGIVVNGASYTASGPLANLLQSREDGEGNDRAFVIAAGITYNSGFGGWNGIRDVNLHTVGLEIEHTGTQPLPRHRRDTACRIAAGCLLAMGYTDAHNACHHWEWSEPPGSKIDVCCEEDGQKCSGEDWRAQTTQIMQGGPPIPPPDLSFLEDDVKQFSCKGPDGQHWHIAGVQKHRLTPAEVYVLSLPPDQGGYPAGYAVPFHGDIDQGRLNAYVEV